MDPEPDSQREVSRRYRSERDTPRRRLRRWWRNSWMGARWRRLEEWLNSWLYPSFGAPHVTYGDSYGSSSRAGPAGPWRRLKRRFRSTWMGRRFMSPEQSRPVSDGDYGQSERSGLRRAWSRWKRGLRHSWIGRKWREFTERAHATAYTQSQRFSPVQRWKRFTRWIRATALIRQWHAFTAKVHDWWYPVPAAPRGHYYGPIKSVSLPVRWARRARRWFRYHTWLGRKLSWLLDDVAVFLTRIRAQVAAFLAWRRVRARLFRWQTAVVLVCLLMVFFLGYKYGRPRYHFYLETQYAHQAQQFLLKKEIARAELRARQVLLLNTNNLAATRVMADIADFYRAGAAAIYWRQRVALLAPQPSNYLALASVALKAEIFPYPTAAATLEIIDPSFRESSPAYHLLYGALELKLNRPEEAERHYAEAVRLDPDSTAGRMSLAVIRLQSRNPGVVADSRTALELLQTDQHTGVFATRALTAESITRRDFDGAERFSRRVIAHPDCAFSDRILHLAILNAGRQDGFNAFLAETRKRAEASPVHVGQLAAWLNRNGYAQEALDWLLAMPEDRRKTALIPLALADAYIALNRWKDLETYLDRQRWPGLEHVRFAMMSLTDRKLYGQRFDSFWLRAVREASEGPGSMHMLAQLSASWGWGKETEDTLWQAAEKYPDQPWLLAALHEFYASRRDTKGLRRVAQVMYQRDPRKVKAANNYAMLSLLLEVDTARAHELAATLYAAEPQNPVFASTFAFALHLRGRTPEGLRILRQLGPKVLGSDPAIAVYYGILLAATGQVDAARGYLGMASQAFLLPEELALVERAQKKRQE